uniref:Uncharacterized protein n=1 Tax=mine drainage metagenome TaxID=410659 RepID=E6Q8V4_9ZZZZ
MKSIELEMQLDKAGIKESVAGVVIVWVHDTADSLITNPWGYCAVLAAAASLTFWLFH